MQAEVEEAVVGAEQRGALGEHSLMWAPTWLLLLLLLHSVLYHAALRCALLRPVGLAALLAP